MTPNAIKNAADLESDAGHLSHLLDTIITQAGDLDHERPDGARNVELERIAALLWIARDLASDVASGLASAGANSVKKAA